METVREQLLTTIRSANGHFGYHFKYYGDQSNKGVVTFNFLKSNRIERYEFELDTKGVSPVLRIHRLLTRRTDGSGFDGGLHKKFDEAIHILKYGFSDASQPN